MSESSPNDRSNSEWIPRDDAGRFRPGFKRCRECDGTGTVQELGGVRDDFEGNVPDYADLEVVELDCSRCGGRGAVHAEGCPRCGGDLHDHGVMPSSCREIGCHDCGFTELVG